MNQIPDHTESARLDRLHRLQILDTPPEEAFDDLTRLASWICEAPIALVTLVDEHRQWFKSKVGIDVSETPREWSFCAHAIQGAHEFVVEDAAADVRFRTNPLVIGDPGIRFYAGFPIITPDGHALGTVCVIDRVPRTLSAGQLEALRTIGRQVLSQIELREKLSQENLLRQERERAAEALKVSQKLYQSLVEAVPQCIFRKDLEGRFTFVNQRACQSFGRPENQVIGRSDFDLFPEDMARKYQRDDQRILETGEILETIEATPRPDGSKVYVHVIKTPTCDPQGQITGIQGCFWDVTSLKKLEEDLASHRDLLQGLLDHVPDRVFFKDPASRFIKCSRAFALYLGLTDPDLAVGKTDFDFFPDSQAQEFLKEEQQLIVTGKPIINKVERQLGPDGQPTWSLVTKVPVRTKNGGVYGIIGISRDITDLKRTEEELSAARDVAVESTRLKSEFLANMSHEIRTPMNGIIGMIGLMQETRLSREQKEFADTIASSADALLTIINDILDFSKIEAGKLNVETIDFDLRSVVEDSVEILAARAQSKKLELVAFIEEEAPVLLQGDPGRLRQILTNLLGNAVKFTSTGEIVVSVTCAEKTDTHARMRFEVRDTGIGIASDLQTHIFEAFTQADGSMTCRYGGTGLGLAISKQLIQLMGGEIGVQSTPGKGSTFWFTVPLQRQSAGSTTFIYKLNKGILSTLRVLIVDDNSTNRRILEHQTRGWKMNPRSVSSAAEALLVMREDAQQGNPWPLVVLDMQMPEMDGLTLAKTIKDDPLIAATRLVMLTSLGQFLDARTILENGISACLIKPIKQSQLLDCLARVAAETTPSGSQSTVFHHRINRPAEMPPDAAKNVSQLRILLAEDNVINQKVALKQLQKLGYTADAVNNGQEAIDALKARVYEVILMDCQMPILDGYDATRRIREEEQAGGIFASRRHGIIAMTANAMKGDREICLATGMDDYVSKPIRPELLKTILQRWEPVPLVDSSEPAAVTTAALDPDAPIDLARLKEISSGDAVANRELIDLYFKQTRDRIQKLEAAIQASDAPETERIAHSSAGASATCGMQKISNHFTRLVQPHFPVNNCPEQTFPILYADGNEICAILRIIV
ncbi:MAG: response regulator, partial [Opitutaceae bacterium]|nr:response regulator [Verrucomicrobiales bacterium]